MEGITEGVNNLNITDSSASNNNIRIQVSNTKKPLFFYVNLAKVHSSFPFLCSSFLGFSQISLFPLEICLPAQTVLAMIGFQVCYYCLSLRNDSFNIMILGFHLFFFSTVLEYFILYHSVSLLDVYLLDVKTYKFFLAFFFSY